MAILADRVTKLKRAQPGYGTRKIAKFGQNRLTLSTRSKFLNFDLISGHVTRISQHDTKFEHSLSSINPANFESRELIVVEI